MQKWWFWLAIVFLIPLGGFAAYLLGATSLYQAVAIGFAAPELLTGIAGTLPKEPATRRPSEPKGPDKKEPSGEPGKSQKSRRESGTGQRVTSSTDQGRKDRQISLRTWWTR